MMDFILGGTKEKREAAKQLNNRLKELQGHLERRRAELSRAIEMYKQSVSDTWEYLQVSDKNVKQWKSLNNLGSMGWELVGIATFAEGGEFKTVYTEYVFKRRIPQVPESVFAQFADIAQIESQIRETQSQIAKVEQQK
jgi:septal ring factor EnvC (AmiA/AmiB activator)